MTDTAGDGSGRPAPWQLMAAAAASAAVPVTVLAWQAATLVAAWLPPLPVGALTAAAAVVTGAGAATGVRRRPRAQMGLWRGLAVSVVQAVALAAVAVGLVEVTMEGAGPRVRLVLAAALAVLVGAFAAGRGVGDACRRQARTTTTAAQRRDADRALPARLLVATTASLALGVIAALADVAPGGPTVARWLPLLVLTAGVVGIATTRNLTLRARLEGASGPPAAAWWRGTAHIGLVVLAVGTVGGAALLAGGERWLAEALPEPPGWPETSLSVDPASDETGVDEAPPHRPSAPPLWQLLAVIALVAAALVVTRGPRRRPAAPGHPAQRMSLWMLIRSVLAMLRPQPDDRVEEETPIEPSTPRVRDDIMLPATVQRLVAWLRPRPREPGAAILHDYRAVQRHLDRSDRRQAAETPLRHADRLAVDDLRELADLVCTTRYTSRRLTGADADRSRELARRLLRR